MRKVAARCRRACNSTFVGAQVLRYNESQAYVVHFDYLEKAQGHDFASEALGTNRFATVRRCRGDSFSLMS